VSRPSLGELAGEALALVLILAGLLLALGVRHDADALLLTLTGRDAPAPECR
jgi:hypothetical protein